MLCKIADLYVEVPEAGGMSPRLREYAASGNAKPDILIREERYIPSQWPGLSPDGVAYMASGWLFYAKLLLHGGMMLHSSAVELDGNAYLFSGPSGVGKSTQTGLWTKLFPSARVFNDDKPALRPMDGKWYAYGTPWSGKHGININIKVPIKGICFLKQGTENKIRRLSPIEAVSAVMTQTIWRFMRSESLDVLMKIVEGLVTSVPVWMMECLPNEDAARLSYETMSRGEL